jgi:hypothetical protein
VLAIPIGLARGSGRALDGDETVPRWRPLLIAVVLAVALLLEGLLARPVQGLAADAPAVAVLLRALVPLEWGKPWPVRCDDLVQGSPAPPPSPSPPAIPARPRPARGVGGPRG